MQGGVTDVVSKGFREAEAKALDGCDGKRDE